MKTELHNLLKEAEQIKSRLLNNSVNIQPDLDWLFRVIHKIADLKTSAVWQKPTPLREPVRR